MNVHHLNCGTFEPRFGALSYGDAGPMVTHVTALETPNGIVLIDTGFGLDDCANPGARVPALLRWAGRARLDPRETAALQLEALGYSRDDVTDIVLTHMDLDHTGGLPDFPKARVHVSARELHGFVQHEHPSERGRYQPAHLQSRPVETYDGIGERRWGFDGVERVRGVDAELWLIPTYGHTRGHMAVAYTYRGATFIHAGDAYYHRGQLDEQIPMSWTFKFFANLTRFDQQARLDVLTKLAALRNLDPALTLYGTHDPVDLANTRAKVASLASSS